MKPEPEIEALRSLQGTIHRPTGPSGQHKEMTMQRLFSSPRRPAWRSPRFLFGGGALCLLAGLSYATGLTQRLSAWFVTVEELDSSTDLVTSQSLEHPDAPSVEGEIPKEETEEFVELVESGELMTVEPVEGGGWKYTAHPEAYRAKQGQSEPQEAAPIPPKD